MKKQMKRAFNDGWITLWQLAAKFDLSESAASRHLAALLRKFHLPLESNSYCLPNLVQDTGIASIP